MPEVRIARSIIGSVDGVSARDALHAAIMRTNRVNRIPSFDRGFDAVPEIERLNGPARPFRKGEHHENRRWSTANRRLGFEVKRAEAPRPTPSMRSAFETLGLDRLDVVHGGTESYAMAPGIRALPAARLATELRPIRE